MMTLGESRIYVYRPAVDFRLSINGLSVLVQDVLQLDLMARHWFVFTNRHRNRVKILYWQHNVFCLWLKRLEQERFVWPKTDADVLELSAQQLQWLLEGYNINILKPHAALNVSYV